MAHTCVNPHLDHGLHGSGHALQAIVILAGHVRGLGDITISGIALVPLVGGRGVVLVIDVEGVRAQAGLVNYSGHFARDFEEREY